MAASPRLGSETFSGFREKRSDEEDDRQRFRLPGARLTALRDITRGVEESDAGIRTRYLVDRDVVVGIRDTEEVHVFDAEAFIDRRMTWDERDADLWQRTGRPRPATPTERHLNLARCRRTLRAMQERSFSFSEKADGIKSVRVVDGSFLVGVLHVAYGWPDPFVSTLPEEIQKQLKTPEPELANLIRYTDATEDHRQVMIVRHAEDESDPRQRSMSLHDRVRLADLSLSSTDAVRDRILQAGARLADESPDQHRVRVQQTEAERVLYFAVSKIQASAMLSNASRAYHETWAAS